MSKLIAENREARFEFEILETLECGIVLLGSELKPLRMGKATISDAYVKIDQDECYLHNAFIPQYKNSSYLNHDELRKRKLLIKKIDIIKLKKKLEEKGLSAIPLRIYFNDKGRVKVQLAIARGKKLHDKRESLKKRDSEREMRQS